MKIDDDNNLKNNNKIYKHNSCELVWYGETSKQLFKRFLGFDKCKSNFSARRLLVTREAAHFWDMVVSGTVAS